MRLRFSRFFHLGLFAVIATLAYKLWQARRLDAERSWSPAETSVIAATPAPSPPVREHQTAALMQAPVEQSIVLNISDLDDDASGSLYELIPETRLVRCPHHHHF